MGFGPHGDKKTPERVRMVLEALEKGMSNAAAAAAAEITEPTFYNWQKRDEEFAEACQIATAKSEAKALERIRAEADKVGGAWTAAAWFLERRWPQKYALDRRRFERDDDENQRIPIQLAIMIRGGLPGSDGETPQISVQDRLLEDGADEVLEGEFREAAPTTRSPSRVERTPKIEGLIEDLLEL